MSDFEIFREFDQSITSVYGSAESVVGRAVVVTTIGQLYDIKFEEDQIPIVLTEQGAHYHDEKNGSPEILVTARGFLTFGKPASSEYTHYQTILGGRNWDTNFLGVSVQIFNEEDGFRYSLDHWEIQDFSRPFVGINGRLIELRRKGFGAELLLRS